MDYFKDLIQQDIYPILARRMDRALPEFAFRDKGKQWVSTNTLHLSGIEGQHGKGKVTVSKSKPYAIGDYREGVKGIISYLIESSFHPRIQGYKDAVKYLADITDTSLKGNNSKKQWKTKLFSPSKIQQKKQIYIPFEIFNRSLKNYTDNTFVQYLIELFGREIAIKLVRQFYIGSSKYWKGATVFWLIDDAMNVAGGQVILFENGSTKKVYYPNGKIKYRYNSAVGGALIKSLQQQNSSIPIWLTEYNRQEGNKSPCLFGLPQLKNESIDKPIAVVESAKTAIICSVYLPQYIWMAVGGLTYLTKNRLKGLEGRSITLFPDKGAFDNWSLKVSKIKDFANFVVSDFLERKSAIDKSDLADYLIKYPLSDFLPEQETPLDTTFQPKNTPATIQLNKHGYPASWD